MAVRIRMKRLGRTHRPFYRICAMDGRSPRNGKVIEELGTYDPMIRETDARAILDKERVDYWLGVGAQPSEKVKVLIKKYGTNGTHLEKQEEALKQSGMKRAALKEAAIAAASSRPQPKEEPAPEAPAPEAEAAEAEASAEVAAEATEEAPAGETAAEAEAEKKTEDAGEAASE